jgi:NADH dehydrogenase
MWDVVTGAFGYSGRYLTRRLLAAGRRVRTLTGRPNRRNPFGGAVEAVPFDFDRPDRLVEHLRGATTVYNTYWVRFEHGDRTFDQAVANTRVLFNSAVAAGVERFVHVSITQPDLNSKLGYFRGKAQMEQSLVESGLSYAILRPTVLFGREDILINNIAWSLRRFPIFALPGDGRYKLQPIYVDDLAGLMYEQGQQRENVVIDAVGPETFTFAELVQTIAASIGSRCRILPTPQRLAWALSQVAGFVMGDVMLTWDEVIGLSANLLISDREPPGRKRLTDWLRENRDWVGRRYANEVGRHFR